MLTLSKPIYAKSPLLDFPPQRVLPVTSAVLHTVHNVTCSPNTLLWEMQCVVNVVNYIGDAKFTFISDFTGMRHRWQQWSVTAVSLSNSKEGARRSEGGSLLTPHHTAAFINSASASVIFPWIGESIPISLAYFPANMMHWSQLQHQIDI